VLRSRATRRVALGTRLGGPAGEHNGVAGGTGVVVTLDAGNAGAVRRA